MHVKRAEKKKEGSNARIFKKCGARSMRAASRRLARSPRTGVLSHPSNQNLIIAEKKGATDVAAAFRHERREEGPAKPVGSALTQRPVAQPPRPTRARHMHAGTPACFALSRAQMAASVRAIGYRCKLRSVWGPRLVMFKFG